MISSPELPYSLDALEPHISKETLEYHWGRHHRAYARKLNAQIEGTAFAELDLEDIVHQAQGGMFNNAAQVWNHSFYWECMSPNGGGAPTGALAEAIDSAFGSFEEFKAAFTKTALTTFGSGWAWLVRNDSGELALVSTSNARTPLFDSVPLLTCDVWEHAYYVDRRNARGAYVEAFWNLVDWDRVAARFGA
ncbi:MAG TPA: superoxide dismutase [Myxococcota bacterium]|nr:superoxide dismutase [Myxococcota bacterium]